ncbi:MAG: Na+/H+ antiporter NhaC family protein [Vicinamibacterales bacterium]
MTRPPDTPPLAFIGGAFGALAPLAVFLAGVGWLAAQGAPDERGFWPVLIAALTAGLLLCRDRTRYAETAIAGMARPIVLLMIVAWLLSGVLSSLLSATGFVPALGWAARSLHLSGGAYCAAAFAACALVSTSTGTSFGTILVCAPLLYPAGAGLGADAAVLLGAILGGATFGDSISPISDTTIASAGTQGADIGGTVRARLKYVLPAGAVAMVAAVALGGAAASPASASAPVEPGSAAGLPMRIVPAVVLGLLLARRHLIEALLLGLVTALVVALPLGLLTPAALLHVPPGAVTARSVIIDGLERGVGVSVFTLLLVGLVAGIEASGVVARVTRPTSAAGRGIAGVEARIVAMLWAAVILTTHSVVAILTVGPYASDLGARRGIPAYRRANLLDIAACTWPFLLPFFLPTILAAGATASGEAAGMPRLSPLTAGLHNAYSWALVAMLVVAVGFGYGRAEGGTPQEAGAK